MSRQCGSGPSELPVINQYGAGNNYTLFKKLGDINNPGPSLAFVFIDEHGDSINDGLFRVDMQPANLLWRDMPASYHGDSGALSFADGHAEIRKWTDPSVANRPVLKVTYSSNPATASPAPYADLHWLRTNADDEFGKLMFLSDLPASEKDS